MPKPILLIDLDGTLVDSEADLAASVNHALRALGYPERSVSEVRSFIGHGALNMLGQAMASASAADFERAKAIFLAHYEAHLLDTSRVFAGWEAVFETEARLVCATNKSSGFARRILDGLGLTPRFALLVGGDTLAVKKPDPAVAAHVAAALGARVDDFVMIGDGVPDGRLAQNCGFPFWAARWGYASPGELDALATRWLKTPAEVAALWRG